MAAFVQQAQTGVLSGTSTSPTLGANPTTGSLLVMGHGGNAHTMTAITGYGVTTWAAAKNSPFNQYDSRVWYGVVDTTPATTGTVTVSGSSNHAVWIAEFSSIATSGTLQAQSDTDDAATGTTATTGPITAAAGPCVYISNLTISGGRTASSPTDGFTGLTLAQSDAGGAIRAYGAYRIDTTPASATSAWTVGNGQWEMVIAAFLANAGTVTGRLITLGNLANLGRV